LFLNYRKHQILQSHLLLVYHQNLIRPDPVQNCAIQINNQWFYDIDFGINRPVEYTLFIRKYTERTRSNVC